MYVKNAMQTKSYLLINIHQQALITMKTIIFLFIVIKNVISAVLPPYWVFVSIASNVPFHYANNAILILLFNNKNTIKIVNFFSFLL